MRCAGCGTEFKPESGTVHADLCPECCGDHNITISQTTRPMDGGAIGDSLLPSRFRVERKVGAGAFGVVSKCWDEKLRRFVAIKQPKRQFVDKELFLREARAASQVSHPNVVRIFDVGEHGGEPFIVSEFVDGGTLREWLKTHRPGLDDVARIGIAIGEGVAAAHELGIIHRDLKPGNILMGPGDQPGIVDFGLSHSRNSGLDTLLVEGKPIGTPAFMAPEQVKGKSAEIGERSDIYSLGTILYQMLTGRLPFTGSSQEILESIVDEDPVPPRVLKPGIPPALEAICLKAMAKQGSARYQSAREFVSDLQGFRSGRRLQAFPGLYRERRQMLIRRWALPALAAACFVGLALATWWIWRNHRLQNPLIPVLIDSDPPGARLTWAPIDFATARVAIERAIESGAGSKVRLSPGIYKVSAETASEYVEVFRTVPDSISKSDPNHYLFFGAEIIAPHRWTAERDGTLLLQPVKLIPHSEVAEGMVLFGGGEARYPDHETVIAMLRGHCEPVGEFLIDQREATWGDLLREFPEIVPPGEAGLETVATGIPFDIALAYAEKCGKSLPTVHEFQFAVTNGGRTAYPWGDEELSRAFPAGSGSLPDGWDQTTTNPPVQGLFGGVREWTESSFVVRVPDAGDAGDTVLGTVTPFGVEGMLGLAPESWLTVGGSEIPWSLDPGGLAPRAASDASGRIGFRTARRMRAFSKGNIKEH